MFIPVFLYAVCQYFDIPRVVAPLVDKAHFRNPSGALQTVGDFIKYRRGGGATVLRVHGYHQ